ncbi:hypothetical protein K7432_001148 [Basidiobolus ranarum]|uniref:RRM domain-containing protein n=1 Tax=Basidiobolus ranarum TaxID=34480 RepID=A0ABR2X3E5_9FUNG
MEGDKPHPQHSSSGSSSLNPQAPTYYSGIESRQELDDKRPVRPQSGHWHNVDTAYHTEIEARQYRKEEVTPKREHLRYQEMQRFGPRADIHPSRMMPFPTPTSPASPLDQVIMSHRRFSVRESSTTPNPIEPPKFTIRSRLGQETPLSWDPLTYDERGATYRESLLSPADTPTRGLGPCDHCKVYTTTVMQPCGHRSCHQCWNLYSLSNSCGICQQAQTSSPTIFRSYVTSASEATDPGIYESQATAHDFLVVKISNIPWDVSQNDIKAFLQPYEIPNEKILAQAIHIIMDRSTGKTLSYAFIEVQTIHEALDMIQTRNLKVLKGRIVGVSKSSQEELMRAIFPNWRGSFVGNNVIMPQDSSRERNAQPTMLLSRDEINSVLMICKNYKLHFSRKCAERPFENVISILVKCPWHQRNIITTLHRDHIFEMLKLAIESLKGHFTKEYHNIDETLLLRMVRAGLMVSTFTEKQKQMLLTTSKLECPDDLSYCFTTTPTTSVELAFEAPASSSKYSTTKLPTTVDSPMKASTDTTMYYRNQLENLGNQLIEAEKKILDLSKENQKQDALIMENEGLRKELRRVQEENMALRDHIQQIERFAF